MFMALDGQFSMILAHFCRIMCPMGSLWVPLGLLLASCGRLQTPLWPRTETRERARWVLGAILVEYGCVLGSPRVTFWNVFCYFFGICFWSWFWNHFWRDLCVFLALGKNREQRKSKTSIFCACQSFFFSPPVHRESLDCFFLLGNFLRNLKHWAKFSNLLSDAWVVNIAGIFKSTSHCNRAVKGLKDFKGLLKNFFKI